MTATVQDSWCGMPNNLNEYKVEKKRDVAVPDPWRMRLDGPSQGIVAQSYAVERKRAALLPDRILVLPPLSPYQKTIRQVANTLSPLRSS